MVTHILQVVTEYDEHLRRMPYVARFSYRHGLLRDDGALNRFFFNYLFCDQAMTIQFMKEMGLLWSKVQCNTWGQDMMWPADSNLFEGFHWRCQRRVAGIRCNQSVSVKHGSWFQQSNLTSRKFCSSRTTSCAVNKPTKYKTNIA